MSLITTPWIRLFFSLSSLCGAAIQAAPQELDLHIPVVDMNDFFTEKREQMLDTMYRAMTTTGFFAVRNTGVNGAVIKKAYEEAQIFFKSTMTFKLACYDAKLNGQRGFMAYETAKGHRALDYKELYHMGRELPSEKLASLGLKQNLWPQQGGFKEAMTRLYQELDQYVVPLQEAIIAVINQRAKTQTPLNYLNETTREGDILLRALYYPALSEEQTANVKEPLFWAGEHTDIDYLAIIPFATEKGLQVYADGQWLNVVVPEDAFIINVGDMLTNLSNGLFVSSRHRVLAQDPHKDRFSMVLFVHPAGETSLAPLAGCIEQTGGVQRFAEGTRNEFLWERLLEIGWGVGLLEPYSKSGHVERQMKFGRASPQVVKLLVDAGLASEQLLEAMNAN